MKEFTKDQLKWFNPYQRNGSVIFLSDKNEVDTIIFFKKKLLRDTTRNFFELGFYSTTYLSVPYKFSSGSYHQSAIMGDGKNRYDQVLFNLYKTSDDRVEFEITFIGSIYNGKELDNIIKQSATRYYFDSKKATYTGMNVEKSINDFTFDAQIGITCYTDERNVKWRRIN